MSLEDIREYLFNRPFGVTIILSICNFWQGLAVNGLYNVALEFIIRQFKLSASFMSSVPASYGTMQALCLLPFTYRFGRKNKPLMMAFCFLIFSLGCMIFTFPHIFSDAYVPMDTDECDAKCESNIQNMRYLFNIGYGLMGIGSMPQTTFAISYIWENNKYSDINTNYHYALIHGCTALGPAAGMVLAGQITTIWVDQVDKGLTAPGHIDPNSKLWVGCWWLPFWIVSGVVFLLALVMALIVPEHLITYYPPEVVKTSRDNEILKNSDELLSHLKDDQCSFKTESTLVSITSDETQNSLKTHTRKRSQRESMREHNQPVKGEGYDWSDLLPTYRKILSNVAYVAMTGVLTANLGFVSVISIYGIQYLSEVYNMSIPTASFTFSACLAFGIMSLPISGYFIRNVDGDSKVGIKKCLSIMRICNVLTILCLIVLFSPCDSQPFLYAGGNVAYNDTKLDTGWIPSESKHPDFNGHEMYGRCASDEERTCECGTQDYIPICGTMNDNQLVTFFSPCHLGCSISNKENVNQSARTVAEMYSIFECNCIDMDNVKLGTCSVYDCDWRIYLIVPCLGLACFLTFFEVVPGTTACQALVSDHLRTAGLGLQAIIFRCFGSIPIPLITAKLIDSQCLWWDSLCNDDRGACRAFDKTGMRISFVTVILSLKAACVIFYSVSIKYVDDVDHLNDEEKKK